MISQLILDNTKMTPGHVTSLFVIIGAALDLAGIYDKFVLYYNKCMELKQKRGLLDKPASLR